MRRRRLFSRDANESRSSERQVLAALRSAADALGLTEVSPRSNQEPGTHAAAGKIGGFDAELTIGPRGWHQVSVRVGAAALPSGISLGPRPTGRGQEDMHLGIATDSGDPRFDENLAVFGPPEALSQHAKEIDQALLGFVAEQFDRAYPITVTSTALSITPGSRMLPGTSADSLRWLCGTPELVQEWRYAERVVEDGVARRVLKSPRS